MAGRVARKRRWQSKLLELRDISFKCLVSILRYCFGLGHVGDDQRTFAKAAAQCVDLI